MGVESAMDAPNVSGTLETHDLERWAALLPTVRVGGALPVTFRADGDHVLVEAIVPYVPPPPRTHPDPNKIPLTIPEGIPVPLSARYKLPPFGQATRFLRGIVREIYHHEIDEQFYVGDRRPFAPDHG